MSGGRRKPLLFAQAQQPRDIIRIVGIDVMPDNLQKDTESRSGCISGDWRH